MAQILVVDDEDAILILLCTLLNNDGHEAIPFREGNAVVEYLKDPDKDVPGLILLDVMMPGMDGYTLHSILQQDKRTRAIPVIVVTAKGQTRPSFETSGNVYAFLEKPLDLPLMLETVRRAVTERPR